VVRSAVTRRLGRWYSLHVSGMDQTSSDRVAFIAAVLLLLAITVWSYWPTVAGLVRAWQYSDDYSACLVVPFVAAFLVWR